MNQNSAKDKNVGYESEGSDSLKLDLTSNFYIITKTNVGGEVARRALSSVVSTDSLLVTGIHCRGKLETWEENIKIMENTKLKSARKREHQGGGLQESLECNVGRKKGEKKRQVKSSRYRSDTWQRAVGLKKPGEGTGVGGGRW